MQFLAVNFTSTIPMTLPLLRRCFFSKSMVATLLLAACSAGLIATAHADVMVDVSALLRAGKREQAVEKMDEFIARNPTDLQMRFAKGVALTEMGKTGEATTLFQKLTDEFPDVPEPYNNLAVLYAASGQYDKARVALTAAIRTNPSYAVAHSNLGDLYAKLASQSYDKAFQLDSSEQSAKTKLTLLKTMANKFGAIDTPPAPAPVKVATVAPAPAPSSLPAEYTRAAPAVLPAQKAQAPTPKQIEGVKEASTSKNVENEADSVLAAVEHWASVWSNQDTKEYLSAYSTEFETPRGEDLKTWANERRKRLKKSQNISVQVQNPKVTINGPVATVKFRQIYKSDTTHSDSMKTLVFIKSNGKWMIKKEWSGV